MGTRRLKEASLAYSVTVVQPMANHVNRVFLGPFSLPASPEVVEQSGPDLQLCIANDAFELVPKAVRPRRQAMFGYRGAVRRRFLITARLPRARGRSEAGSGTHDRLSTIVGSEGSPLKS